MGATDNKDDWDAKNISPRSKPLSPTIDESGSKKPNDDSGDVDDAQDAEHDSDAKPQVPMQKRRRVTRACDECRRKKIKCDGKQPCTHCTVYSYDCTYDQPSNRRRNPAPHYIEALEQRLQKAEAVLRAVLPDIDLDDPKYEARSADQILEANKSIISRAQGQSQPPEDDAQMRSMVDRTGSLDLDDSGFYDYHGNSSGYNFIRKFRAQFGDEFIPVPRPIDNRYLSNAQSSPKSLHSSPFELGTSLINDLPPKDAAIELCRNAIDDCCALQRPLHRPTFFARLDAVYNTDPENYTTDHVRFLPSLYAAMAVGCLFGRIDEGNSEPDRKGYHFAIDRGYQYFNIAKSMLDVSDCRDIMSIQAVMFMILFLQGTAKLSTCYAYIGVALRACCRLGMHRKIVGKLNFIEQEERKRLFWQVRKMDVYVGAMLGLPQMLSNDDIDQDFPTEVSDEHITAEGILSTSQDAFPLIKATNAHTRLLHILQKAVRYVYPVKSTTDHTGSSEAMISHSLIRELERDLQDWMDELPMQLRPSDNANLELARVQQLLRMSYAYVQMMIYRPFVHYVAQSCQTARTDKRSFACAAACVSVARNIVHITSEMKRRGLLMGAYWFVMYTTYFAILSLLYFVLENPESSTSKDILKDAVEGRDTLANLATWSLAADRCSCSLAGLFEALPEKLNERRSSLRTVPNTGKKRPPPNNDPPFFGCLQNASQTIPGSSQMAEATFAAPTRTRTMPQEYLKNGAKRLSMPEPTSTTSTSFPYTPDTSYVNMATTPETSGFTSSHSATPAPLDFGTPAMVQGRLPDLKSVMFPGDNPFAYPNQPMSTLDTMPSLPFGNEQSGPEQYDTPTSMNAQQFNDRLNFGGYHSQANQTNQQQFLDFNMMQEPGQVQQHNNLQVPSRNENEDYWSHAPAKGNFRTGLTPGGQGVHLNLDDIFGNALGWTMPMNLDLPDDTQQSQGMQWPGRGEQNW